MIAEIQHITYNEFLPAMGVTLPTYRGYNPGLNPAVAHEFATVGYRAHSIIHGEIETDTNVSRYSQATLDALEAQGVEVEVDGADVTLAIPAQRAVLQPRPGGAGPARTAHDRYQRRVGLQATTR